MGLFSSIVDKLLHHSGSAAATPSASAPPTAAPSSPSANHFQHGRAHNIHPLAGERSAAAAAGEHRGVPSKLAASKGGGGNSRTSIVDLLKLLDLDSSLASTNTLAQELNIHTGADGWAEQNIALQKGVMQKLVENGGKVPDSLRNT